MNVREDIRPFVPQTPAGRLLAVCYVASVAFLAVAGWSSDHDGFSWVIAAALLLTLPALLLLLPAVYLIGGVVNGAVAEHHRWPLAMTFAITLGSSAAVNVGLFTRVAFARRRRRAAIPEYEGSG